MPRPTRISLEGLVYRIINRGNNRQAVFRDDGDFSIYLKVIRKFYFYSSKQILFFRKVKNPAPHEYE